MDTLRFASDTLYNTLIKHPDTVMPLDPMATLFRLALVGFRAPTSKLALDDYKIVIQNHSGSDSGFMLRASTAASRSIGWNKGENLANLLAVIDNFSAAYTPSGEDASSEVARLARIGLVRLQREAYREDIAVKTIIQASVQRLDACFDNTSDSHGGASDGEGAAAVARRIPSGSGSDDGRDTLDTHPIEHDLQGYAPWTDRQIEVILGLIRFNQEEKAEDNPSWSVAVEEAVQALLSVKDHAFREHCRLHDIKIEYL